MRKLTVRLQRSPADTLTVGTLAEHDRRIYFEYDSTFLDTGLQISPFKLALQPGLIAHTETGFGRLPGVFDDSLPDGWGLLLMDRHFRRQGMDPAAISPLDRLAYIGTRTMGALTYHPPHAVERDDRLLDLCRLSRNAEEVLAGRTAEVLPELMRAGGSPAGARPKVLVGMQGDRIISGEDDLPDGFEHWLVKFAAKADARDAGPIEYAYSLMAKAAGVDMPATRLIELAQGRTMRRYFAVQRFDRGPGNRRIHVHTFANIVHINFRLPASDYADLFRVTRSLTHSHADVQRLFRLMVFNITMHNRDDHAKNFAFMLDDGTGEWSLAPAYDLTYCAGPGGEHTTSVLGEGRHPKREHCLKLAEQAGIPKRDAAAILEQVNAALSRWSDLADRACCTKKVSSLIAKMLQPV